MGPTSIYTISIDNVIETYNSFPADDEDKETILYFMSELTGLSVDRLIELAEGD